MKYNLGTSHNLSWRGGGGGEIVFYPKLFPDPYSIAPMFLGTLPFNLLIWFKGPPFLYNTQMVITSNIFSTFQYTFFTTYHPPGAKKGFVKGEALRLLRTNFSVKTFEENITTFKKHLLERGYPQNLINNTLSEVKFQERTQALLQRNKTRKRILPFITQ